MFGERTQILAAHFTREPEKRFPPLSLVAGCTRVVLVRTYAEQSGNAVVSARQCTALLYVCIFTACASDCNFPF